MKQNATKLHAKDLITIGIFTALYMAACVVFEIVGGFALLSGYFCRHS